MKTYFRSSELPHQWAHQLAPVGRCPGNERFDGPSYFSYSTEIARIVERKGKGKAYILNETNYSVTTNSHLHGLRRALVPGVPVFYIGNIPRGNTLWDVDGKALFEYAVERATVAAQTAARSRSKKDFYLSCQARWLESAKAVSEFFGLRRKVDEKTIERLAATAKREEIKRAQEKARHELLRQKEKAETILAWLRGEQVQFPYGVDKCYLRVAPATVTVAHNHTGAPNRSGDLTQLVETSRGVLVPMADVQRGIRFAMARRAKGWKRNGEQFKVGDYQLDAVNEFGVVAGCHRIDWTEIERFAASQGWLTHAEVERIPADHFLGGTCV